MPEAPLHKAGALKKHETKGMMVPMLEKKYQYQKNIIFTMALTTSKQPNQQHQQQELEQLDQQQHLQQ